MEIETLMLDTPLKDLSQLAHEVLTKKSLFNTMPTGFKDLDQLLEGFAEGELIVVGGRPAMGKTLFLLSLALNMSKTYPLLYLSYDLSEYRLIIRILSALSGIEGQNIANLSLSEEEKRRLEQIDWSHYQLTLQAEPHQTVDILLEYCTREIEKRGIRIIMIDFLQLLHFNRYRRYNRDAEMDEICRKLKTFARQHQVCIVAASSLNRSAEYRHYGTEGMRPQLSDLRDSGSIEQLADKVLFLYRPEYYKIYEDTFGISMRGILEVDIAKNTAGSTGEICLKYNGIQIKDLEKSPENAVEYVVDDYVKDRLKELGIEKENMIPF
jgi:replicative DNA helicase